MSKVIAVDLGATSGRVIGVELQNGELTMEEIHRFRNIPVEVNGWQRWDVLHLWHEIQEGIQQAKQGALSIGVDCWGVDFAFLDKDGNLVANPPHYRSTDRAGAMDWVFERVSRRAIFERTGIQFMPINGLFGIAALVQHNSPVLDIADTVLTIADLFNYWLSGSKTCEFTEASTMQMVNPRTRDWDTETMEALNIPKDIFPQILEPGTRIGDYNGTPVIASACHDTGSAVVAVPTTTSSFAYLSSGTWSLLGLEVDQPIINDEAYTANVTNEGGAEGTFRLLKNVAGMWLLEQSMETWRQEGKTYSYDDVVQMASEAEPFYALFNPDNPNFITPGDMPARIREACKANVPQSDGQLARAIFESLAMKYRYVLEKLITLTDKTVDRLHIIGGGSQNALLNQMTADAVNRPVYAGPTEATALGNGVVQLIAMGELKNIAEARHLLASTYGKVEYIPRNTTQWDDQYQAFLQLLQAD